MQRIVWEYALVKKALMPQLKHCRDKELRCKAELLLYGLKIGDVALACKRLGFGRSSYYKWRRRLMENGLKLKALKESSRAPKRSPQKLSLWVERKILRLRRKGYGPAMIRELLLRENEPRVSLSTIQHVINARKKPVKKRKAPKLKKHRKRYELHIPGQRLQLDVKYTPVLVEGARSFVYVAIDECTRWRFSWAYSELNEKWTVDFLNKLLATCPFPIHTIQTDNGVEFTFKLLPHNAREHAMDKWCKHHKIHHRLIPPGLKELNGKVERSHRIDADYFYGRAPTHSLEAFNKALMRWLIHYNEARPHGGVRFMTPLEKLAERRQTLSQQRMENDVFEHMRQRFIKEVTLDGERKRTSQIEKLELELRLYNLDYAS